MMRLKFKSVPQVALLLLWMGVLAVEVSAQGREGNQHYRKSEFEQASQKYQEALAKEPDSAPELSGLLNNLGSALYMQGRFDQATTVFSNAVETAPDASTRTRAAYNAGNNAVQQEQLEAALAHYKQALLADPANVDAKFNYEFVKRQLEQQEQRDQQDQNQENQDDQEQNEDQENQENQDQQQENQEQQNEENQEQDQNNQNQDQQNQQPQDQENQREQPQQPNPEELSREQAERILEALQKDEKDLLKEVLKPKARPRRVKKDW